jgi:hypothetical protein
VFLPALFYCLREGIDYFPERFRGAWETVYQEKCWLLLIASQTNLQFGTFNLRVCSASGHLASNRVPSENLV